MFLTKHQRFQIKQAIQASIETNHNKNVIKDFSDLLEKEKHCIHNFKVEKNSKYIVFYEIDFSISCKIINFLRISNFLISSDIDLFPISFKNLKINSDGYLHNLLNNFKTTKKL